MGTVDRVPQKDLDSLANGGTPPGIPLDDSEVIFDLCKRWVSLAHHQREGILRQVKPRLFGEGENRERIISLLAGKCLTRLSEPVQGWRRLSDAKIRRVVELLRITRAN